MEVQKTINSLKKQLHESEDVADRVLCVGNAQVGFLYLKSMTDNAIFSENIFKPISNFVGNLSFEELGKLVQPNDVKEIKKSEVIENVLKGSVVIFKNNKPVYVMLNLQAHPMIELSDDEKVEVVAKRILEKHRKAFEVLAE